MCACFRCTCGFCKCKFAIENNIACKFNLNNKNSTYLREFLPKSLDQISFKTDKIHNLTYKSHANPVENLTFYQVISDLICRYLILYKIE